MSTLPPPDVYGEPTVYVCRCYHAHGVAHLCALCRATKPQRPTADPWVSLERCHTCIADHEARLLSELAVIRRRLDKAEHAVDGVTGKRIPPHFLTLEGWRP